MVVHNSADVVVVAGPGIEMDLGDVIEIAQMDLVQGMIAAAYIAAVELAVQPAHQDAAEMNIQPAEHENRRAAAVQEAHWELDHVRAVADLALLHKVEADVPMKLEEETALAFGQGTEAAAEHQ